MCFDICSRSLVEQIEQVIRISITDAKKITKANLEFLINENIKKALDYELYLFRLCEPRLDYYLNKSVINLSTETKLNVQSIDQTDVLRNKKIVNIKFSIQFLNLLITLLKANNADPKLVPPFTFHDCSHDSAYDNIIFVKARSTVDTNGILLQRYKIRRHWRLFYNPPEDILFQNKKSQIFWRGASSGKFHEKRYNFVKLYFNNLNCNVGLSRNEYNDSTLTPYLKSKALPTQFLNFKYIMSIEGNDKDSGLQWKLNSNSVVFMPRPTKISWLMEDTLVPGKHYILIKDDFSDIDEKFKWCEKHPKICERISKNAKTFMQKFKNFEYENIIEYYIMKYYLTKIHLV